MGYLEILVELIIGYFALFITVKCLGKTQINHGKIDMNEMKKNRLDIDQLQQLLRSKDIFSLQDVTYAIYENNGELNILQKPELEIPTYKDLKIPTEKEKKVPVTIISDGKVLFDNLHQAGLNENWLQKATKFEKRA